MPSSPPRRPGRDDGAVAVIVAIVVVGVIMPLMVLVVDLGLSRMLSQQSRGGADAAALAAAALKPDPNVPGSVSAAINAVQSLVAANVPAPDGGWAWGTCVDPSHLPTVPGPGQCISFDFMNKRVRVTVPPRNVPTVFSGLFNTTLSASAATTATWGTDPVTCGLCVLGHYVGNHAAAQVTGGDAAIGGNLSLSTGGSLTVAPAPPWQVTLAGVFTPGTGSVAPFPVAGSRPLDFFASSLDSLRVSTPNGLPVYGQPSLTPPTPACVPGIWQTISNCTTFQPGTYFVTGNATGTAVSLRASAASVRLFFTCRGSGGTSGVVAQDCTTGSKPSFTGTSIGGGRTITVSAPGGSGLALVFDKGLTGTQGLVGAGRLAINGDVYGPDATLSNSGTNTTIVTGHVVIGSVSFNPASPNSTTLQVALPPPQPVPDGPVRLVGTG